MKPQSGTVLHVSPHPDDEVLGAPATLMALRDAGWRIVNLACSMGRPADAERRRAEVMESCRRAGFALEIPADLPPIGEADDLERGQWILAGVIGRSIARHGHPLIVGPSPDDAHPGHQVVGRALIEAMEAHHETTVDPMRVMFWGLWRDLPLANVLVPFDADRLAEIKRALGAHAGELARNRYDRLLEGRAVVGAVLGPERVFGFGSAGISDDFAELLMDMSWSRTQGWRPGAARVLDPLDPLAATAR